MAEPTQTVSNDKSFRVNSEGTLHPVSFNTSATCVRQLCTRFRTFTPSFLSSFLPSSSISRAPLKLSPLRFAVIDYPLSSLDTRAIDGCVDGHRKNRLEFRLSILPPRSPDPPKPIQRFNTREVNATLSFCYHVLPFPIKDLSIPVFDGGAIINSWTRRGR